MFGLVHSPSWAHRPVDVAPAVTIARLEAEYVIFIRNKLVEEKYKGFTCWAGAK